LLFAAIITVHESYKVKNVQCLYHYSGSQSQKYCVFCTCVYEDMFIVLKLDRSNSQSQSALFLPVSSSGSPWSSVADSRAGQSLQTNCSIATTVTSCKLDAAVLSGSAADTLQVSNSLARTGLLLSFAN